MKRFIKIVKTFVITICFLLCSFCITNLPINLNINESTLNVTSNLLNSVSDISGEIDTNNYLNLDDYYGMSLSYKVKFQYFKYIATTSNLTCLDLNYNPVYNKHINVDVFRKLNETSIYKYLFSYNSKTEKNNYPQIYIYSGETYLYKFSSYNDDGIGVEFSVTGNFNKIIDYDYYYKDLNTSYTYGIKYETGVNEIKLNTNTYFYKTDVLNDFYKNDNVETYPYNTVGQIKTTFYNEKNSYFNGFGTGAIIEYNKVLTCAHVLASFDEISKTTHFVDSLLINVGQSESNKYLSRYNFKSIYVDKNYFINNTNNSNYDIAIAVIDNTDLIDTLNYIPDLNFSFNIIDKMFLTGYPGDNEYNGSQYISPISNFRRLNNFKYTYFAMSKGGVSGSPIFYKSNNKYYVIGVHTSVNNNQMDRYGTIINYNFFHFISNK